MFEILDDRRLDLPAAWGPSAQRAQNDRARSRTNKVTIPAKGQALHQSWRRPLQLVFEYSRGGGGGGE
ncbi:hypothetical protein A9Z42_0076340 [Trichoderma parareesei]|uniref:Uncharacterized protein n=1 Tax=Trichoderma parareesei TaxID=858221 RepID=A0A2H2ZQ54_TRIPA|nr:hypothetical protein A9Z42_0076340 [Trichoderma parareesei]